MNVLLCDVDEALTKASFEVSKQYSVEECAVSHLIFLCCCLEASSNNEVKETIKKSLYDLIIKGMNEENLINIIDKINECIYSNKQTAI